MCQMINSTSDSEILQVSTKKRIFIDLDDKKSTFMMSQSKEQIIAPGEQPSSSDKCGVPPKELLDEFNNYRPLLVDWLESLDVDSYSTGLHHTERAGWHLL